MPHAARLHRPALPSPVGSANTVSLQQKRLASAKPPAFTVAFMLINMHNSFVSVARFALEYSVSAFIDVSSWHVGVLLGEIRGGRNEKREQETEDLIAWCVKSHVCMSKSSPQRTRGHAAL